MAVLEAISTVYCEDDVASIEWTGITQSYDHLQIRGTCQNPAADAPTNGWQKLSLGGSSYFAASKYHQHILDIYADSERTTASSGSDAFFQLPSMNSRTMEIGAPAMYSFTMIDIFHYSNTSRRTTIKFWMGNSRGISGTPNRQGLCFGTGFIQDTPAIEKITFDAYGGSYSLSRGTCLTLYGWNIE